MAISPPVHPVRFATPADLHRLSVITYAGFCDSPLFRYQRCYHTSYPEDTLLYYQTLFLEHLKSADTIIVVAVDAYDPSEGSKSNAVIVPGSEEERFTAGQEVAVGFCVWRLQAGSKRMGQFHNYDSAQLPSLPENQGRDQDKERKMVTTAAIHAGDKKYFSQQMMVVRAAIHPAYWRRGHGKALLQWGTPIADLDGVKVGVMSSALGVGLYKSTGFISIDDPNIEEEGDGMKYIVLADGIKFALMQYVPKSIGTGQ